MWRKHLATGASLIPYDKSATLRCPEEAQLKTGLLRTSASLCFSGAIPLCQLKRFSRYVAERALAPLFICTSLHG